MSYYDAKRFAELPGHTIKQVFFGKQQLAFVTETGHKYVFGVEGDCCSQSEFWDFYGVKNLLSGGKVIAVDDVELDPSDGSKRPMDDDECVQYYGHKIVVDHPEFGETTAVFSFRNLSNGYYGGWMHDTDSEITAPEIFDDVTEAA